MDRPDCRNQAVIKFWHSETVCVTHLRSPSCFSEQLNWRFWDMEWTLGIMGVFLLTVGVLSFKNWMLG